MESNNTIAHRYIQVLEQKEDRLAHRGAPANPRAVTPYVSDPYNMSPGEYRSTKKRIKQEYKERNRATQKKLNQSILGSIRRKIQKRLSYREKKNKELADLQTKYRRSLIDKEYGNLPGAWKEDEKGKYPVGTQGKPKAQRGRPAERGKRIQPKLPAPSKQKYDVEAEWDYANKPHGYIAPPPPKRYVIAPPHPERARPSLPSPPKRPLPSLPSPRRHTAGLLPPAREVANKVRLRRGSRR